jgi:hypothetical protein
MRRQRILLARLLWAPATALCLCAPVRADLVVVGGDGAAGAKLTRDDVINIYMGRYRAFPDGRPAHPLDAARNSAERERFYRLLLKKSPGEVQAYWARLVFSGRTRPPRELPDVHALTGELDSDPLAIAYVERKDVTRRMQILFFLEP